MKSMNTYSLLLFTALLLLLDVSILGCGSGTPNSNFSSSDKNVATGSQETWSFDTDGFGTIPKGVIVDSGTWEVRSEADAPSPPKAFCQTGSAQYPAVRLSDNIYADSTISVRFKPISGNSDRAAGIIFRAQDKDNYYILRANALENNVNLYIYAGGIRSTLKEGSAPVNSGVWQTLKLDVTGADMKGYLNDQLVVEANNNSYQAGNAGLWTKSDSVTCFDDLKVSAR